MGIIDVNQLTKIYKKNNYKSLDALSVTIEEGKIYGLIGPNGAGKTTFVKCVLGAIKPTEGTISILGCKPGDQNANKYIGYVCEKNALSMGESAYRYLFTMAILSGLDNDQAKNEIDMHATKFEIKEHLLKPIKSFSSGMKKKIQIIAALFNQPKLLILDEPTENLDPNVRLEILNFIKEINDKEKVTVIYCSHNLYELEKIVDNIMFINKGKLILEGNYQTIIEEFAFNKKLKLKTSENQKIVEWLKDDKNIEIQSVNPLVIKTNEINELKSKVIAFTSENSIIIDEISQEEVSMYDLFSEYTNKSM